MLDEIQQNITKWNICQLVSQIPHPNRYTPKRLKPLYRALNSGLIRLEPRYPLENIEAYEKSYAKNEKWGQLQDVFRNPTNEFKEEVLTFNALLKSLNVEENALTL